MLVAQARYTHDDILKLDPDIRSFLFYYVKEGQREQFRELGRMLGSNFTAGEIRNWGNNKDSVASRGGVYRDGDPIFMPLSIAIKPELREGLMRMVGGVAPPMGYKKRPNEVIVDLGQVTPKEFIDFVNQNRRTKTDAETPSEKA